MSSVLALWVEFVYVFKRRHHRVTYSLCDGSLIPAVVHQKYIRKQIQIHFARERDVGACNRASASYTTTKFCNNIPFIASTLHVHTHAGFMHIYLAVVAFALSRSPRPVTTRVVVIWAPKSHEIGPHFASHRTHVRMGCVCGKPVAYDDHATPEERRARALQAAENRSQASDRRGIKVRRNGAPWCTTAALWW
jgi:hypothetical protein